MSHVFTYGSLMFDQVWSRVVQGRYQSRQASLSGYRRCGVKHEHYPVIYRDSEASEIVGVVYLDVNSEDLLRLDRFEGGYYVRIPLKIRAAGDLKLLAETYVLKDQYRHIASAEQWDPEVFETSGITPFLRKYQGFQA